MHIKPGHVLELSMARLRYVKPGQAKLKAWPGLVSLPHAVLFLRARCYLLPHAVIYFFILNSGAPGNTGDVELVEINSVITAHRCYYRTLLLLPHRCYRTVESGRLNTVKHK